MKLFYKSMKESSNFTILDDFFSILDDSFTLYHVNPLHLHHHQLKPRNNEKSIFIRHTALRGNNNLR